VSQWRDLGPHPCLLYAPGFRVSIRFVPTTRGTLYIWKVNAVDEGEGIDDGECW
jgi:hypothetical protein